MNWLSDTPSLSENNSAERRTEGIIRRGNLLMGVLRSETGIDDSFLPQRVE